LTPSLVIFLLRGSEISCLGLVDLRVEDASRNADSQSFSLVVLRAAARARRLAGIIIVSSGSAQEPGYQMLSPALSAGNLPHFQESRPNRVLADNRSVDGFWKGPAHGAACPRSLPHTPARKAERRSSNSN